MAPVGWGMTPQCSMKRVYWVSVHTIRTVLLRVLTHLTRQILIWKFQKTKIVRRTPPMRGGPEIKGQKKRRRERMIMMEMMRRRIHFSLWRVSPFSRTTPLALAIRREVSSCLESDPWQSMGATLIWEGTHQLFQKQAWILSRTVLHLRLSYKSMRPTLGSISLLNISFSYSLRILSVQ